LIRGIPPFSILLGEAGRPGRSDLGRPRRTGVAMMIWLDWFGGCSAGAHRMCEGLPSGVTRGAAESIMVG
jgi:hypothetical protein